MSARGFFLRTLLPCVLFPALSLVAARIIFTQLFGSGTATKMTVVCTAPVSLSDGPGYLLPYTGVRVVDDQLCGVVTFFQALLEAPVFPLNAEVLALVGVIMTVPFVEAARRGRPFPLSLPTLMELICQVVTFAVTCPVYWLLFIRNGASSLHTKSGSKWSPVITKSHAEAIMFSVCAGYIIPTAGLMYLVDPYVTAFWQPFPVWISVSQLAHRFVRRNQEPGHAIIRNTYFVLFCISFFVHSMFVWPLITSDHVALYEMFMPPLSPNPNATLQQGVVDVIKWDAAFALASSVLATLWFAHSLQQLIMILLWYCVALPLFGPGASVAALFLWREDAINRRVADGKLK